MRKVVVEHNIVSIDGKRAKACVMSGDQFEFDDLCEGRGCTWEKEGFNSEINREVTFNQTFLITDLTDEELLNIFI
jgi:hypothetical protein